MTPPTRVSSVQRTTISERVYYEVKRMIARAELPAGAPLVIRDLAAKLRVSRMPVVEAIRRLERDGLVAVAPKWGAVVKEWTWDEIVEAYHIRRGLEGVAAELFVQRATPHEKKELVELNNQFNHYSTRDVVRCDETDVALHQHIARATRFPRLYDLIENSNIERTAILGATVKEAQGKGLVDFHRLNMGCHDVLVKALLGNNPRAARTEIWRCMNRSLKLVAKLRKENEVRSLGETTAIPKKLP